MSKIVEIFYCADCPHKFFFGNDMCCDLDIDDNRIIQENEPIPNWCPLPDDKYIEKEKVFDKNQIILDDKKMQKLSKLIYETIIDH